MTYFFSDLSLGKFFSELGMLFRTIKVCDRQGKIIVTEDNRIPYFIKILKSKECCKHNCIDSCEIVIEDEKTSFVGSLILGLANGSVNYFMPHEEDIQKISKEAERVVLDNEGIKIILSKDKVIFFRRDGLYEVIVSEKTIPFHEICKGPAKAGIAQFIGHNNFYPAFAIIGKWLKGGKK